MQQDYIKEMQQARNEGGIDTKVSASSWACVRVSLPPLHRVSHLLTSSGIPVDTAYCMPAIEETDATCHTSAWSSHCMSGLHRGS